MQEQDTTDGPHVTPLEMNDMRHFGPMHAERTRRHQMTSEGNSRREPPERTILTLYEVSHDDAVPKSLRLCLEVMVDGYTHTARLTVDEARELAGAAAEFVRLWQHEAMSSSETAS